MWQQHAVTAEPTEEPITVEEARAQVELTEGDDSFDTLLNLYIPAARGHFEDVTGGHKLITQTVEMRCSCWADLARLPIAPLQSITSVKYLDTAGDEQTLAAEAYETIGVGAKSLEPAIRLKIGQSWPQVRPVSDAIRVVALAGYGAAANVPAKLKHPLLLLIGHWFAQREAATDVRLTDIPHGVMPQLENHRL
jgi:uncharacterized phiE125 gp8 family phage protein